MAIQQNPHFGPRPAMSTMNSVEPAMLTSADRLHQIDQLREKNIGQYFPLPQLVAAGDQSSGKSSLLENLTGIPFPRGQELCTRYATQITHRRDQDSRIIIKIIPSSHASPDEIERLKNYERRVESSQKLRAEFPAILEEVNQLMGIRTSRNPLGYRTFSEDVLKIEKWGPREDYLTVIDVPGIFRNKTEGITTVQDRSLVERMVKSYIKSSETIILAVLSTMADVATQEILSFAEEVDERGERTLGILTKPDLLNEKSAKAVVCSLVEGKRRPLTLGYYVVRSRGGDDEDETQDAGVLDREKMFAEDPWCKLPVDRIGIVALRDRLQGLLSHITARALPKLRSKTRQMLTKAQEDLNRLGPPRQTEKEQQRYLVDVASNFQNMVRAALTADYPSNKEFEGSDFRLITTVVNMTEKFNTEFLELSHTYSFDKKSAPREEELVRDSIPRETPPAAPPGASPPRELPPKEPIQDTGPCGTEPKLEDLDAEEVSNLNDIIIQDWTIEKPIYGIMSWISNLHRDSRGLELGTFSPRLLCSAFREQSVKWDHLAGKYLSKVILAIHRFVLRALFCVCPDPRVYEELKSTIMPQLLAKYSQAMQQAMFLVQVERGNEPYTLNHYFNSNLQQARHARMKNALASKARKERNQSNQSSFGNNMVVDLDALDQVITNQSNAEQTAEDIYDILHAYYKVASKRFIDNVYHQAVGHCLLSGPMSPLRIFSEAWVLQLDDDRLLAIAGESRSIINSRERLNKTIEDLEEAVKILR